MNELDRPYHKAAQLFPLMEGDEFAEFKADIAANGLLEPIWIDGEGQILDGRNRHRACIELGLPPKFRTWNNGSSPTAFVVSLNLHRRHLTPSQKAVIALDVLPMLEKEAHERQRGGQAGILLPVLLPEAKGDAREQAAQLFQVSPRYVSDAKKLQQHAPDLLEQVRTGEATIPRAKRELVKRQKKEAPPLPTTKYRVFYADPPWKYNDSGIIGEMDHYGHTGRHYPSMSIDELCAMGTAIKKAADENSVLFLWVTSPMLEECFKVINAWGFKYKTSFVWDKVGHNYGHYNSVRHEFLLICTRGSCTPDIPTLFDSVQAIEKSSTHSEKPAEFRTIIDTLYPQGRRLELFARTQVERWDSWGNEGN